MKKFLLLLLVLSLPACSAIPQQPDDNDWWQDAVFYEIFVRSFNDSDCDGIGDFNGITEKLDYLQDLGVTALWLMPIHPSATYHGYDVINFYAVNHEYGSMEDFQHLVEEAHRRDMHIVIDLVMNHTSPQHPWFIDAKANPDSPYRDWYIWSETNPGYRGPMGNAWHQTDTGYFYSVFYGDMPDLNYRNPEVTAQMYQIINYWLTDIGIDGFRLDAVKHLVEEGEKQENTESTHAWLRDFYIYYKDVNPQAYTIGEVAGAGAFMAKTYTGDQVDQVFNFDIAYGILNSAKNGNNQAFESAIAFTLEDMPDGNYATFLTNHDQERSMNVLGGDVNKAKAAASLLLTAQGTPFIYYGEEIGMQGKKPDEDIRRPMQWSAEPNAGFACPQAEPWRQPYDDFGSVNVADQLASEDSLLYHYQLLIHTRKNHPALYNGAATVVETDQSAVFAVLRTTRSEQILVIVNLSDQPIESATLSLTASPLKSGSRTLEGILGSLNQTLKVTSGGAFTLTLNEPLAPYQTLILNLD